MDSFWKRDFSDVSIAGSVLLVCSVSMKILHQVRCVAKELPLAREKWRTWLANGTSSSRSCACSWRDCVKYVMNWLTEGPKAHRKMLYYKVLHLLALAMFCVMMGYWIMSPDQVNQYTDKLISSSGTTDAVDFSGTVNAVNHYLNTSYERDVVEVVTKRDNTYFLPMILRNNSTQQVINSEHMTIRGMENIHITIDSSVEFRNESRNTRDIPCSLNDKDNSTSIHCPTFRLKDVCFPRQSNSTWEATYASGVSVAAHVYWHCDLDESLDKCFPRLSFECTQTIHTALDIISQLRDMKKVFKNNSEEASEDTKTPGTQIGIVLTIQSHAEGSKNDWTKLLTAIGGAFGILRSTETIVSSAIWGMLPFFKVLHVIFCFIWGGNTTEQTADEENELKCSKRNTKNDAVDGEADGEKLNARSADRHDQNQKRPNSIKSLTRSGYSSDSLNSE